VGVKDQVLSLKPWLVGKDPLEIDRLYVTMGEGTRNSAYPHDGSAHNLMRAVSGIEWRCGFGGKVLGAPATTLLGQVSREGPRV